MNVDELLVKENIDFKVRGNDCIIACLNPSHEDSNPSLHVDIYSGIMHCFSCGFKGNLYNYFGVATVYRPDRIKDLKDKIQLYLNGGISIPETATLFKRDYRNIKSETYEEFNAFTSDQEIHFRDRLVFPITNIYGKLAHFVARSLHSDAQPKYLIMPKGSKVIPFPSIPEIFDSSIILVEGIFDMLNLHDKGLTNTVSCFGLNRKSEDFVQYKLQGVHKVYILFDNDKAGEKGAVDMRRELNNLFHTIVLKLDKNTSDPGQLTLKEVQDLKEHLYNRKQ